MRDGMSYKGIADCNGGEPAMKGNMGQILRIDLGLKTARQEPIPKDLYSSLIGGKGLGIKILMDLLPPGTDALDPANPLIFVTGPLTGTLAPSMRGCLVAKAPLTGMFDDSYFGGHLNQEIKYTGHDAVVITGKAPLPTYLIITDDKVEFREAAGLWGRDTYETCDTIKAELGESYRVACIGPAGENLVKFALVDCEPHRHAGRGGLGAVFGAKNLKAVAVKGTNGVVVEDPAGFLAAVDKANAELMASTATQDLAEYSSVSLFPFANEFGFFPVRNFGDGTAAKPEAIDGKAHTARLWMRHWACAGCPIHCGKMSYIRRGPYAGTICDNVEYETVGLIGGNLDISSLETMSFINQTCDKLGLDTISTGGVVGFAIEAFIKGILDRDTTGGIKLSFGEPKGIIQLIRKIAFREGIGDILADGVAAAAAKLGRDTEEFACQIQGLETPAWGPRGSAGMGLAYLTGDRGGCHQRAFPIGFETGGSWPKGEMADGRRTEGKGELVAWEQNLLAALYSLTICEFGRSGISTETYLELLAAATGLSLDERGFLLVGERIWNLIRLFNLREGWSQEKSARLPARFKDPLPSGLMKGHKFTDEEVVELIGQYNIARGWDKTGRPEQATMEYLGLQELQKPVFPRE